MVTILSFEKRKNKKDEDFNVLIIQGGVEAVTSKESRYSIFCVILRINILSLIFLYRSVIFMS
jgi:hypothetical protein